MENKVMIITGARKGIGRYLSEFYIQKGLFVIGCSRSETDLKHDNYEHFCLDVSDERLIKNMLSKIVRKYKRIDYLINNAGIASMNHSFLTPLSVVEKIFKTNFFGTFLFCRETGKIMAKHKFGRIVNFSTIAVPLNLEGESIYASSKAAVEQLTKIIAKEFGEIGITCNTIGPTPIKTDLIKNIGEEKLKKVLNQQAIKEFSSFEDITNIIDFFISEKSKMITGQTIYLGGVC
jgi:3-oxoacyl-[acyl-carrier protein] reductase